MNSGKPDVILLDHTADLGIMVRGADLKDLFTKAANAMMQLMVRANPSHKPLTQGLSVTGQDLADLMVCWLGEILYLFVGEKEIVTGIEIGSISPSYLDANLETVSLNENVHEILYEIKAVTYHQIEVVEKEDHWESKIIFDL